MVGKPGDLVRSYPPYNENYVAAVKRLESYVKELLSLVLNKNQDFSELVNKIENYIRCLEALKVATDKFSYMLYPLVEAALPEEILRAWNRHGLRSDFSERESVASISEFGPGESKLEKLITFLRNEVDSEERIQSAKEFKESRF